MVTFYFSGTGNTKYLSEYFSKIMNSECYSIEDDIDFKGIITGEEMIVFCYPVYGSCVPEIMREFVVKYKYYLNNKIIIILCTQMLFSGDGARVFTELIKDINVNIVYAEHFNMPNNICNLFLFPPKSKEKVRKHFDKTDIKLYKTCDNINNGIVKKKGFNIFSKFLGWLSQRMYFGNIEKKAKNDVRVRSECNGCLKCVQICPKKNLEFFDNRIQQKGECTLCYRCVNKCPQKAITVLLHSRVKRQYGGWSYD